MSRLRIRLHLFALRVGLWLVRAILHRRGVRVSQPLDRNALRRYADRRIREVFGR